MAHRTDAADARHQGGHLIEGAAFAEFFESAKLRDVKMRFLNAALVVEVQRNLGMALDPRYRINDENRTVLLHSFSHLQIYCENLFPVLYAPKRVFGLKSGCRPSSNSVTT